MLRDPGTELERHELSEMWGDLTDQEVQELATSIMEVGQLEAIKLHEGKVVDGWHRYKACIIAGSGIRVETIPTHTLPEDLARLVVGLNARRRHMASAKERAKIVLKTLKWHTRGQKKDDVEHDDGRKTGVRWIADVIDPQTGEAGAFAIAVAPQDVKVDGRVTMKLLDEAGDLPMVVVGTEFDDPSAEDDRWRNKVYRVRAGADLHIGEVTEKAGETPRLTLVSELDAEVVEERGRFRVRVKGANEWNPVNRRPSWRRAGEVRMWMLDTDHDGFQFHACRIHLPEKARLKEHRKFLLEILGKDGDPEAVNAVFGMESMPFDAPQSGEIAIRAVLAGGGISTALLKAPALGPAKGNAR